MLKYFVFKHVFIYESQLKRNTIMLKPPQPGHENLPLDALFTVPMSSEQIRTMLKVFPLNFNFLPSKFAACSKPPSININCHRTQHSSQNASWSILNTFYSSNLQGMIKYLVHDP